jgi:hypothetical protein
MIFKGLERDRESSAVNPFTLHEASLSGKPYTTLPTFICKVDIRSHGTISKLLIAARDAPVSAELSVTTMGVPLKF